MAYASHEGSPTGKWRRWSTWTFLGVWTLGAVVFGSAFIVQALMAGSPIAAVFGLVAMTFFAFVGLRLWRSTGLDIPAMPWTRSGGAHRGVPYRITYTNDPGAGRGTETGSASSPGPFDTQRQRSSTRWFWIGGLAIAAGALGAIVGIFGLVAGIGDLERIPFNSGGTVELDEPGGYVVYAAGNDISVPGDMRISVVGPDGRPIPTEPYGFTLTLSMGERGLKTVATFEAPTAGAYQVTVADRGSAVAEELAVGRSLAGSFVTMLFGGGFVAVGVATVVFTWRRSRRGRTPSESAAPVGTSP